jgi:hypothetical protein
MRRTLAILLCAVLAACASARGEMDKYLDEQVGKSIDDPTSFRAQQAQKRIHTGHLRNGHVEEEYLVGFRDGCRVFLEVDDQQKKIVNWRYGLTQQGDSDCYMSPNVGR